MWKLRFRSEEDADDAVLQRLMRILWLSVGLSAFALLASQYQGILAALGIGTLILLASFAGGCFFGFLFGLPKVAPPEAQGISSNTASSSAQPAANDLKPSPEASGSVAPTARARLLQSSTNLEKISDWLTTMIVGASLVELHRVNDALLAFRLFLETTATVFPVEGGAPTAGAIPTAGTIILIFGAICGFLYMYLNTRLVLVRLFAAIERFLAGDTALPASQQRIIAEIADRQEGLGSTLKQQASSSKGWTVDDALGLMFDLLYKDNPDRVIHLGAELSNTVARERAEYWFYLAAAFGQKLHGLPNKDPEWMSARDNALDAARRAIAIAPSYRERLWAISNPESTDDDLVPLRRDPEFLKLVGRA
ncbi:MAG: hypothetical protein QOG72_3402 [Sphingomonadales bacterium]|jgi:hypothetical protein|nr:hypothetical protein [Sphingomonadales bacterium]